MRPGNGSFPRHGIGTATRHSAGDGKTLILAYQSKIRFWETRSGRRPREIELPEHDIRALDASPDGKSAVLAARRFDPEQRERLCSAIFRDLASGKEQAKIEWTRALGGPDCCGCRFTADARCSSSRPAMARSPYGTLPRDRNC